MKNKANNLDGQLAKVKSASSRTQSIASQASDDNMQVSVMPQRMGAAAT